MNKYLARPNHNAGRLWFGHSLRSPQRLPKVAWSYIPDTEVGGQSHQTRKHPCWAQHYPVSIAHAAISLVRVFNPSYSEYYICVYLFLM